MRRRTSSEQSPQIKPAPHPLDEWERGWLEHWSKAGTLGYELPKSGPAGEEAAFLTEVRSPEKETDSSMTSPIRAGPRSVVILWASFGAATGAAS